MGIFYDIHLGLSLGVIVAIYALYLYPKNTWTPYFFSFAFIVPLVGYGKPISNYVTVFLSGWIVYYINLNADYWADIAHIFLQRGLAALFTEVIMEHNAVRNFILSTFPDMLLNFILEFLGVEPTWEANTTVTTGSPISFNSPVTLGGPTTMTATTVGNKQGDFGSAARRVQGLYARGSSSSEALPPKKAVCVKKAPQNEQTLKLKPAISSKQLDFKEKIASAQKPIVVYE